METLGEYIRLNKQTLATAEELEMVLKDRKREDLLEEFSNKPTGAWLYNGADVYFKDKDGNFATFQLAYNDRCKISEFEPIKRNGDGRERGQLCRRKKWQPQVLRRKDLICLGQER